MSKDIENKCKGNLDNIILPGDLNCHRDYPDDKKDTGDEVLEDIIKTFNLMDTWTTWSGKSSEEGNTYLGMETRIDYVFLTKKFNFPLFDISIEEPPNRIDSGGNALRYSDHLYFELNTSKVNHKTEANKA